MITGQMLKNALISGANNLQNHRTQVDALNVFPVPDGDTGTNMSQTCGSAVRELQVCGDGTPVCEIAKKAANALLRGARGNSGVILSLIFRGVSKGFKGLETADGRQLAAAFQMGQESAYKAVMKPTEGTILTVVRKAAQAAVQADEADEKKVIAVLCDAAKAALAETPELLPVLKEAGVVDAGGQGFLYVLEGMRAVIADGVMIQSEADGEKSAEKESRAAKYPYRCSLRVQTGQSAAGSVEKLRAYLQNTGDGGQAEDTADGISVRVDTAEPDGVLRAALACGTLHDVKIEYRADSAEAAETQTPPPAPEQAAPDAAESPATPARVEPEKEYGFVAVAAGEGLEQLFYELGADRVVSGGQTMNPSTDDILNAIQATPARHVFVLPNNKNIIMAAEQTVHLADRGVSVLATRTVPQGITAMLSFDEDLSPEENHLQMMKAAGGVHTAQVTFAARDSEMRGERIKKGQMLGMEDGKITLVSDDLLDTAYRVTRRLVKKYSGSLVTVFYGADADEAQANALVERLQARFPNVEINCVSGGQPVYYFLVSVE